MLELGISQKLRLQAKSENITEQDREKQNLKSQQEKSSLTVKGEHMSFEYSKNLKLQ